MEIPYKDNWEETEARMLAFWDKRIIGRVPIAVIAQKPKGEQKPVPKAKDSYSKWMDPDFVVNRSKTIYGNRYFLAEAIPAEHIMAGFTLWGGPLGGEPEFREETIWQHPFVPDLKTYKFNLDLNSKWWQLCKTIQKRVVEEKAGFPSTCASVAAIDTLSIIRGPENLCMDLIENPEIIKSLRDKILDASLKMFDEAFNIIQKKYKGSTAWIPLYSPGKYYTPQCDFSCMISVDMFDEFVLPEIEAAANFLDHSIYHLDGPGAIRHLDSLLKIKNLNGIQWVPGAGALEAVNWTDLLKKILKSGKCLHIDISKNDVAKALKELPHEGLFLQTWCDSKEEAEEVIALVNKMS